MGLKRRDFLKRTGLALAVWGAGDLGLSVLVNRYHQALAESTRRKLALLVGINQYRGGILSGCVTDVELQRELLIYRFGFQPQDILTLTDQQATREAIETAFVSHLTEQARSGDVVVFHFSGYGGNGAVGANREEVQPSLVPVDGLIGDGEGAISSDLLEETLGLLVRSLQTDKITTILDTSYTYPGKSLLGNLRIRTRPASSPIQPDKAELVFQEQLLNKISPRLRLSRSSRSPLPGIRLAATTPTQLATEARWNGFSAGLFTYALTRHLWQAAPATSLQVIFSRTKTQVEQLASQEQQPQLSGQKSQEASLQPYNLPVTAPGADGVVTEVEDNGKVARIWLAGLPATLLEHYGINSLFTLVGPPSAGTTHPPVYLQLTAKEGLAVRAKLYRADSAEALEPVSAIKVGQFVQERVRVLPRNIGLTVALDSSLERIERVDAISAFTAIPRVSSAIAGEQPADYLFSKIQINPPTQVATATNLPGIIATPAPAQSAYGLFSLGQDAIPNTAGEGGEAVKFAVRRLVPKLQTLLAAKLLNLTVNETSSQLAVRMTLERLDPQPQTLLYKETWVLSQSTKPGGTPASMETGGLLSLPVGSRIQYRMENHSAHPLYPVLLGLDSSGNLIALYAPPTQIADLPTVQPASATDQPDGQTVASMPPVFRSIAPGEVLMLPPTHPSFQWTLNGPPGLMETYLICSRAPLTQTQTILETALHSAGNNPAFYPLPNPMEVAQAVLQDLHQASDTAAKVVGATPDSFALDVTAWASLRFVYQVV
ncbi:caspase family protein [Leptothermofonsia sp. ETS-13]|uniref:caspase family protein n=1 Tax=Leptothermofonsia sp. ETS-13 TaxID=3035696 RepID=UPI003BA37297